MPIIARSTSYDASSRILATRLSVWNRRLLVGAVTLILWAASMLALQAAGPEARAMMAAEGMMFAPDAP